MTGLLLFFAVVGLVVGVHEFGHYIVARWCGVHVNEFAIGMGPKICSWTARKAPHKGVAPTRYVLRLLPIGGYVMLYGATIWNPNEHLSLCYAAKPVWKRIAITLAGPGINLLVALVGFMTLVGVREGAELFVNVSEHFCSTMGALIAGERSLTEVFAGPVGIAKMADQITSASSFYVFVLTISFSAGLVNLLPIPGLDGGKLVGLAYEGILRRRVPLRVTQVTTYIGAAFVIVVMLVLLRADILR